MKTIPSFQVLTIAALFIFSIPANAQYVNLDSLLERVQHTPDNSDKVLALKKISREYFEKGIDNSAILYMQQGQLIEKQVDIRERIAQSNNSVMTLNPQLSDVKEIKQELVEIGKRMDTLQFAINEYNRRTMSFADDLKYHNELAISRMDFERKVQKDLAKQREKNTRLAIVGGLLLSLLLALVFFQFYRRRQAKTKLELNQLQNKVLRSQLNPHFIFNALNSVRNYIQKQPEIAGNYLTKFSTLMRQVLENSQEEKITLEDEIAMLENYMQLESLRVHQGFDYEIFLDDSVDAANTLVPPLILQPILENAIWHGLDPLDSRGRIKLSFTEKNNLLEATIEDDGVGVNAASTTKIHSEKKRSLGLQITRERIELLNRKAKAKGFLSQQLFLTGSQVKIAIPI